MEIAFRPGAEKYTELDTAQAYRQKLAALIRGEESQDRGRILAEAQGSSEYWEAYSAVKNHAQHERMTGDGLGVFIENKVLYHGTSVKGIESFKSAEEYTVGEGIYLTSEAKDAVGYAQIRSNEPDADAIIYKAKVDNAMLCDLRSDENMERILVGFKDLLVEELKKPGPSNWSMREGIRKCIRAIDNKEYIGLRLASVTHTCGKLFTQYLESLGYGGLITYEGGESNSRVNIGNHDTYVIFDPQKVIIRKEQKINEF